MVVVGQPGDCEESFVRRKPRSVSGIGIYRQRSFAAAAIAITASEFGVLFLGHFGKSPNSLELCRDHNLTGLIDETPLSADADGG
jgi:hypothetical protein